eukprot:gene12407-508_t
MCKSPDSKDPTINVPHIFQSGTNLPEKAYYIDEEKKTKLHEPYMENLVNLCKLADVECDAKSILDFETKVAELHYTNVEKRNPDLTYNPLKWKEVQDKLGASFAPFFKALDLDLTDVVIDCPRFYEGLGTLIEELDLHTLKNIVVARMVVQYDLK